MPETRSQAQARRPQDAERDGTRRLTCASDRFCGPSSQNMSAQLLQHLTAGVCAVFFGIAPVIMDSFRGRCGMPPEWTPIAAAIGHPSLDSSRATGTLGCRRRSRLRSSAAYRTGSAGNTRQP
jgi:hypothetical protein